MAVSSSTGDALRLPQPSSARLWEVDALRGIAIVLMIYFHLMWDLFYFGLYGGDLLGSGWQLFARSIGATFLFVMGLSATLTHARLKRHAAAAPFGWYLRRGLRIFACGLLVTAATYVFAPSSAVLFGILHLLGVSLILVYPFLEAPRWVTALLALVVIGVGWQWYGQTVTHSWLLPLGLPPAGRFMLDYYPLLPWFGFVLLGVLAGRSWYADGRRRFSLPDLSEQPLVRGLRFLGRHSLLIYLLHQPLLIGALLLVLRMRDL